MVDAVTTRDGRPLVDCARAGDAVLRAGDLSTEGVPTAKVFEALSGRPGETRRLTLERDGKTIACAATVVAF